MGFFFRLILGVVFSLLSAALYKAPPGPRAAAFDDFGIPKARQGDKFKDFAGTMWVSSSEVAWAGDLYSTPIYKGGGKK